jgi:hypothetical protein
LEIPGSNADANGQEYIVETTSNRSRREFLAHLTALGAAGLLGSRIGVGEDALRGAGESNALRLDRLRPEDFAKHVGQTFAIHDSERCLEAELIKVKRRPRGSASTARREAFSVIFQVPANESVPHQVYTIEHALMGRFDLFVGAIGQPSSSSVRLEAVFA